MRKLVLACVVAISAAGLAGAQESGDKAAAEAASETEKPVPEPVLFETTHSGTFNGTRINYRVEAGETYIKNDEGEPAASLFTISYIKADAGPDRPVAFVFNGGPGSASVWLHLGLLGPKRAVVASNADADDGAAPYRMVDNPLSLLDVTDLVFIDPVGTGFSRAIGKGEGKDYWNEDGDKGSIGEFIRLWLNEQGRWNAPKYLIGESFGTTRAAYLAEDLARREAVAVHARAVLALEAAMAFRWTTVYLLALLRRKSSYLRSVNRKQNEEVESEELQSVHSENRHFFLFFNLVCFFFSRPIQNEGFFR